MNCNTRSYSPSSEKHGQVVSDWLEHELVELVAIEPATLEVLSLAHDLDHVQSVLVGKAPTGFGIESVEIAEAARWTVGSMIAAMRITQGVK